MKIKLSQEIAEKIKETGNLKTKDLVAYILESVRGAISTKGIEQTALKDISFDGRFPSSAVVDMYEKVLVVEF